MKNTIDVLRKIIPNELEVLKRRYNILKGINNSPYIGRRHLAQLLNYTEKITRNEVECLKDFDYINILPSGMIITDSGKQLILELEIMMNYLNGLTGLQENLKKYLHCDRLYIVPGDADENQNVKNEIGKVAANELLKHISNNSIIAIAGGSTAYSLVNNLKKQHKKYGNVLVVPARGSLRNNVEYQANTIAAILAEKISAHYELLNLPDNLSRKALESISKETEIQKIITKITDADIVIYGIGNANQMANIRNLPDTVIDYLIRKQAVAEALGYYFDKNGEIVYMSRSIGVKLEQITKRAYSIAVAGGKSKAKSILAVKDFISNGCLVIDEGAAKEMLQLIN